MLEVVQQLTRMFKPDFKLIKKRIEVRARVCRQHVCMHGCASACWLLLCWCV
jgi:hypothetical protein